MKIHQGQQKDKAVAALYKRFLPAEAGVASILWAIGAILFAVAIIFAVSLADQETRQAYEKVNTVPVENGVVPGND